MILSSQLVLVGPLDTGIRPKGVDYLNRSLILYRALPQNLRRIFVETLPDIGS